MKFRWGFEGLHEKPPAAGAVESGEAGQIRKGFMGEATESARGVILLSVSMILLMFNLLNGERNSRP